MGILLILATEETSVVGLNTDIPLFLQGCGLIILGMVPIVLWFIDHRNQNKHEEEETAKIVHIVEQVMAHDEAQAKAAYKAINDQRDDDRESAKDVAKEVKAIEAPKQDPSK